MELKDVREIKETSSQVTVNKFLKAGWVLLATASMTTDSREYASPVIKYSLGWTLPTQSVHPEVI